MDFPNLLENQFAVRQAELATGIILKSDGTYYSKYEDYNMAFQIFNSFKEAKEFVIETVLLFPERECYISDYNNETIFYFDKNGEHKL